MVTFMVTSFRVQLHVKYKDVIVFFEEIFSKYRVKQKCPQNLPHKHKKATLSK